ncbi:MAG: hypothetical protein WA029_09175, partial [Anaerolineae bacterium]
TIRRLLHLLNRVTADEMRNQVYWLPGLLLRRPPCPPNPGGKSIRLLQDWGQRGTPGAIEIILTAWLSSYEK